MEFDNNKIQFSHFDINKGLVLPNKPSKELAEFIGILAGDGHISFNTSEYKIHVTGHSKKDHDYLKDYVRRKILQIFNIDSNFAKRKNINAVVVSFHSKAVVGFMKYIGYYKHTTTVKIPSWILNNQDYMIAFTRGLYDTDGCVFASDKKGAPQYPCIELTTICLELACNIKNFLESKGFRVSGIRSYYYSHSNNASYKVSLYGWVNLSKWLREIGFSNNSKLDRAKECNNKWGRRNLNVPRIHV